MNKLVTFSIVAVFSTFLTAQALAGETDIKGKVKTNVKTGDVTQSQRGGSKNIQALEVGTVGCKEDQKGFLKKGGDCDVDVKGRVTTNVRTGKIAQSQSGGRKNTQKISIGTVK